MDDEPTLGRMQPFITPRGVALTLLGSGLGLFSVIAGRPTTAIIAVGVLAWVVVGALGHRWPDPEVSASLSTNRVVEGDTLDLYVDVGTAVAIPWLEIEVETGDDLPLVAGIASTIVSLPAGRGARMRFELEAPRWGVASPERLRVTARDRLGLFASRRVITLDLPVRIHPSDRRLDAMIQSTRTRARVGHHLAPQRGDGCEYADIRPAQPGDRLKSVNWRVSLRRGTYWVSDRHPDQASDLVLLVDSGQGLGKGSSSTLHHAVRAALALTEGHLATHDRVGLLDVGRQVRWFRPGMGRLQRRKLIDALLEITPELGLGVRRAADLPLRGVGSSATIVALSPLIDPRPVELLLELHRAGYDLVVVWCEPDIAAIRAPGNGTERLARRLWDLERDGWRRRLTSAAVPVVAWSGEGGLDNVIALLDIQRRSKVAR